MNVIYHLTARLKTYLSKIGCEFAVGKDGYVDVIVFPFFSAKPDMGYFVQKTSHTLL